MCFDVQIIRYTILDQDASGCSGVDLAKWIVFTTTGPSWGHLLGADRRRIRVQPARRCQQFGARSCVLPPWSWRS